MFIRANARQAGVTLIELIVFIIIVGVALAGVLSSLNVSVRNSADPFQPKQALVIAESVLDQLLATSYAELVDSTVLISGYTATVKVNAIADMGGGVAAKQIVVEVVMPNTEKISLAGYRTNY